MTHSNPRTSSLALVFALAGLPLACKSTETHDRAATTADSIVAVGGVAGQAQLRLDQTLDALEQVAARSVNDPKPPFDAFAAKFDDFQDELDNLESDRVSFENRANTWLAEYAERNETIQDAELRQAGATRVADFRSQIAGITQDVDGILSDARALEARLLDVRTFLGNDLTPQAVRTVSGRIDEITRDGRKLAERLGQLSKSSSETAGKLRAVRTPPAPPADSAKAR